MDFDDTPAEAAFRSEARAWLAAPAPAFEYDINAVAPSEHAERSVPWQGELFAGGWAGITWPTEYGGRGASAIQASIFNQEQARYSVATGVFMVGIGMAGPTLIAHGTKDQRKRYLRPLLAGREI